MKKFGIYVNIDKDADLSCTGRVERALLRVGAKPAVFTGREPGERAFCAAGLDVLIVIGGDGTILRVAAECAKNGAAILGINHGRLGFLTEVEEEGIESAISRVAAGEYLSDTRMMLDVRAGERSTLALNEAAVLKRNISRTIALTYGVDGEVAGSVVCDGLLVSTPTGTTAYSLSAGGSVIIPQLGCIAVTAVCPHSLSFRPMILSAASEVAVWHESAEGAAIAVDGSEFATLGAGEKAVITRSAYTCEFIRLNDFSFYHRLREKLSRIG